MQQCLSATFGLAPFFSYKLVGLLDILSFEVLTYRWGVATVVLLVLLFLPNVIFI